jgi:hypothetical protein
MTASSPGTRNAAAEKRELRRRMRAQGLGHDQVAAELARRYGYRPRKAFREAHGLSAAEAAAAINACLAAAGLDPEGRAPWNGSRLWEHETVRHEAPCNRVEVKDRHRRLVAAGRRSWGQPDPGDAGEGGKQPRQRRDALALPDGAGLASEAGRCTRGTGALKLHKAHASSNPVDTGWFAARARPLMAGRATPGLVSFAGREATVKDCGVAVARLLGQSRAPSPLIGSW